MTQEQKNENLNFIKYTFCGTFLYAVCAGFRDNYGIMLPYMVDYSGIPYATISFIIALGQLFFGFMQPVFAFLALRTSCRLVFCLGAVMMFTGLTLIPFCSSAATLTITLGILLPSGTASASFGIIMSCIGPRLSGPQSIKSGGFIAAGIGISICFLSPIIQSIIASRGLIGAITFLGAPIILLVPVSLWLSKSDTGVATRAKSQEKAPSLREIFGKAFSNAPYRALTFAFFTCGFHMAMIQTHLFSQLTSFGVSEKAASYALSVYGIGVIAGSVGVGLICAKHFMPRILAFLYGSRCIWVALLLLPLPMPVLFGIILLLGMTGVASTAPTGGSINAIFGPARMATLFGFTYLIHQTGAFASAWAGGLSMKFTGDYSFVWYADILLCLLAAIGCWRIKTLRETATSPEDASGHNDRRAS